MENSLPALVLRVIVKMKSVIAKYPFFLFLLPFFFVLHGYGQYFPEIDLKTAGLLFLKYMFTVAVMAILFWPLFKNRLKTSLAIFFLLAINLFWGSILDFIKANAGIPFLTRYIFIVPFTFILIFFVFIYLKKTKSSFTKITLYLNFLFLLLIAVDLAGIILKFPKSKEQKVANLDKQLIQCDTCKKPDIYLIVADEYAGKTALKDLFDYDNTDFEKSLKERNFQFIDSSNANYNATVYSMASVLNMDYLNNLKSTVINYNDMLACYNLIRNNNLTAFLKKNAYSINNFSFYDLDAEKKIVTNHYFPDEEDILTYRTFLKRIQRDLGFHLFTKKKTEKILRHNMYNNIKTDSLLNQFLKTKREKPAFVYTHLDMPHHSYYNRSNGELVPVEMLTDEFTMDRKAYIEYLKYTNTKLIELIDNIKLNAEQPPIILLMSDHGFRQLDKKIDTKFYFMNLNAIHMPDSIYSGFYNGMSAVNQFRTILNLQFGQQLPLLKDSTILLTE